MEGIIRAVCVSEKKGLEKIPVDQIECKEDWGIIGDAHAGHWHRQVSLLAHERVVEFNQRGGDAKDGAFGENILVDGIDFKTLPVGTIFTINQTVVLKMTQIGKECHTHCAIFHCVGDCIMPREGVFCEVVKGGIVKAGDKMEVTLPDENRPFQAAVITLSDKGFRQEREDLSGPMAANLLKEAGYEVVEMVLLPDEPELLKKELIRLSDQRQVDLILTSGGTGFSLRDQTPEATKAVMTRDAPGIAEYMRMCSAKITNRAMLSRGASVIRNSTLIINLPGSPRAVKENLEFILDGLDHGLKILRGSASECARK